MNFIEKNAKKVALFLCFATAGTAVTTAYAMENSTGWKGNGADRVYINANNEKATGWLTLEDGVYFCNDEGHPVTGWQTIDISSTQMVSNYLVYRSLKVVNTHLVKTEIC